MPPASPVEEKKAEPAVPPPPIPPAPAPEKKTEPTVPPPPAPPPLPGASQQPAIPLPPPPLPQPISPDAQSAPVKTVDEALSKPSGQQEAPAPAGAEQKPPALSVEFKSTETTVPLTIKPELDKLAKQLKENEALRVTLIAYASSVGDQSSTARRVSLSRALSVRAYLIDAGVNNLRINVQAEGDKNPGGNPDRVDLFVQDGK